MESLDLARTLRIRHQRFAMTRDNLRIYLRLFGMLPKKVTQKDLNSLCRLERPKRKQKRIRSILLMIRRRGSRTQPFMWR